MRPSPLSRHPRLRVWSGAAILASVALLGACGGSDGGDDNGSSAKSCTAPSGATPDAELSFDAVEYAFEPETAEVAAGVIEISMTDEGQLPHTLVFEDCTTDPKLSVTGGSDDVSTTVVQLEPGTYDFYCDVPGHRGLGMEGSLTVQ